MIFELDDSKVPDGTVMLIGVRYAGSVSGKVYDFAALKAGGRWYFTGTGPSDAGWGAVQRWLQANGRSVVYVKAVTGLTELWPDPEMPPLSNDAKARAKARHPSRTGSPAASMRLLEGDPSADADLVTPEQRARDLPLDVSPERAPWEYSSDEPLGPRDELY